MHGRLGPRAELEEYGKHSRQDTRGCIGNIGVKIQVQDAKKLQPGHKYTTMLKPLKPRQKMDELELSHDFGSDQIDMAPTQSYRYFH